MGQRHKTEGFFVIISMILPIGTGIENSLVHHHPTFEGKEKEREHPAPRQGAWPPAPPLPNRSLDFALGTGR